MTIPAADAAALLLRRMREQRARWVPLDPEAPDGPEVRIERPPEAEFGRFVSGVTPEHVAQYVTDWRGFTDATLLGAAFGSTTPVEFDRALWAEYARDRADVIGTVATAIAESIAQHLERRREIAGKSPPSST